jgi:GDP-L-fucose synthase
VRQDAKVFVAGHAGMVGSALVRRLEAKGYTRILTAERRDLDLLDAAAVAEFFRREQPEHVLLAAGKIGGIYANHTYRADFLYENLVIEANVIHQAFLHAVRKLLFFACNCIYPKNCPQPMGEDALLSGPLEPTSEPFAIAKLAGMKLCESYNRQYGTDFITVIPTNLYGPNQKMDLMTSMVVPSLIQRFRQAALEGAPEVAVWGTGAPVRDFLYVDDLAEAAIFLMENYEGNLVLNVGTGKSFSIGEVATVIARVVGYGGRIVFDPALPDGAPTKVLDGSKLAGLGWRHQVELEEGIRRTYEDYLRLEGSC